MDNWRESAACRTVDPDLFFPIGSTGPALPQVEEAKAVCRRCPVRDECLRWALDTGQTIGVWGGTSENERRTLRRRTVGRAARDAGT
ncbi:WhiB family transcriptional regulator [Streptomyces sp. NPDC005122]